MNDRIKQAIYDELAVLLQKPGQQTEERLKQLEFTEGKLINLNFSYFNSMYYSHSRIWHYLGSVCIR